MTKPDRGSIGSQRHKYPLDAAAMARTCRKLASDLRAEAAAGWGPVQVTGHQGKGGPIIISRAEAAASLDAQADRWEAEATTGVRNQYDRARLGQ